MTFLNLLPPIYANVRQHGALGDGSTDDTVAIAAAISAAVAAGGGTVFYPPGTYITTTQILVSGVQHVGAGIEASVIKLKNATNADLFSAQTSSINLSATYGTGSAGTLYDFGFQDITLDGNKANQSSGPCYPLRFYGYGYILQNVRIRNGYSGGILSDWNGGSGTGNTIDNMESFWSNVKVHDTGGIGIQFSGPHDSMLVNVISYNNLTHAFHFAPNCGGTQCTHLHGYGSTVGQKGVAILNETSQLIFVNCQAEGGDVGEVAFIGSNNAWRGGRMYDVTGGTAWGIKIGQQAGETPLPGQILQSAGVTTALPAQNCMVDGLVGPCEGTNGAIWLDNDNGYNTVRCHVVNTAGSVLTGTQNIHSLYELTQNGLTPDGTVAKGGGFEIPVNASLGWRVTDGTHNIVNINTTFKRVELANATAMRVYSDDFGATVLQLNADNAGSIISSGSLSVGQSASAPTLASSGTITTSSIGAARVAPTGNVTGIILQAGTQPGQVCTVVNESAFSIVLAASGTSHVADGVADVIGPNASRIYTYDTGTSLWYGTNPVPLQSATAPVLASSGTISTTGLAVSRVAPSGAVTGIVVQAGTYAGQMITIVNESVAANTITFAASGTSNVAGGTGVVIAGLAKLILVYDTGTNLWY